MGYPQLQRLLSKEDGDKGIENSESCLGAQVQATRARIGLQQLRVLFFSVIVEAPFSGSPDCEEGGGVEDVTFMVRRRALKRGRSATQKQPRQSVPAGSLTPISPCGSKVRDYRLAARKQNPKRGFHHLPSLLPPPRTEVAAKACFPRPSPPAGPQPPCASAWVFHSASQARAVLSVGAPGPVFRL